jgi:VanZ family protein
LHALFPHFAEATLLTLHEFIRKCGHFCEYFILGLLLFRAIRAPSHGWHWRWAFLAILLAAFYASSDEIHQIFVPSRGASAWDALLDTCGATIAQLALWVVNQGRNTAEERNARARVS